MSETGYDLSALPVMHNLHPIQPVSGSAVSSSVRLGFKWATAMPEQGIFLCVCSKKCLDTARCGRTFHDEYDGDVVEGTLQSFPMPWTDGSGNLVEFDLWTCPNCTMTGTGSIMDVWVGRFYDIPARLLQYEHEARSRNYLGLRKSLGKAYPDEFAEASFVTLVLYRRAS